MPAAVGRRRRFAPRVGLGVDGNHPLARGLWFHRTSAWPGRAGGSPTWAASRFGRCIEAATVADKVYAVPVPKLPVASLSDFTLHSVKAMSGMSAYAAAAGVPADPQNASWGSPYWVVTMAANAGDTSNYFHTNNAGSILSLGMSTSGFYLLDSLVHSYTGSWGVGGAVVYRDGAQFETSATQPNGASSWTPSAVVGTPETVFLGRSASSVGEGFLGRHVLSIAWTRRLSAAEVAMVAADPFCMLAT